MTFAIFKVSLAKFLAVIPLLKRSTKTSCFGKYGTSSFVQKCGSTLVYFKGYYVNVIFLTETKVMVL